MTDFIIVPRIPDAEQIRFAARNLLHREPNDAEYRRLHQVYQDMARCGTPIAENCQPQGKGKNVDPDSAMHQVSE